ncbi:MAG: hypothetical protein MK081_11800 [Flavobacteriales bacterium]|nr:hypothetical protein [Flavobacteriales bacterium]
MSATHAFRWIGLTVIFLIGVSSLQAQEKECPSGLIKPSLSFGYLSGATLSPNQFDFAAGFSARGGFEIQVSERLSTGLSFGFNQFGEERFLPFGINLYYKNPDKLAGIYFETGYTSATSQLEKINNRYELHGGIHMTMTSKWTIPISEKLAVQPEVGFTIHGSETQYTPESAPSYSIDQQRVGVLFRTGVLFNR